MNRQLTIQIPAKIVSYPIWIGEEAFQSPELIQSLKSLNPASIYVITDSIVEPLHGKRLKEILQEKGFTVFLLSIPAGELHKTRQTKMALEDQMLDLGAGRDACIIGLGGGVVTDVAGFLASTYCRGIPAFMLPTSLLAMVDASIGGKTGVDVPQGKNLIGTIYQPNAVFMDTASLVTLPLQEVKNGIVEMIKHGLIADKNYFLFMRTHAQELLSLDLTLMEEAIYKSCLIKASIVAEDETEKGKRRLLNFGHTVGHAIETATGHAVPHGRAVAMGIAAESYLSMRMGFLKEESFNSILDTLHLFQIDLSVGQDITSEQLLQLMRMDKKALKSKPRFVLLREIGEALDFEGAYVTEVKEELLKNTLEWMFSHVMHSH